MTPEKISLPIGEMLAISFGTELLEKLAKGEAGGDFSQRVPNTRWFVTEILTVAWQDMYGKMENKGRVSHGDMQNFKDAIGRELYNWEDACSDEVQHRLSSVVSRMERVLRERGILV